VVDLGLTHPSLTPVPKEFRSESQPSTSGERRVAGKLSAYVSPMGARVERRGEGTELRAHLATVRAAVVAGASILEAVADGTLMGWRAREVLSHVVDEPVANWDQRRGRTQLERLAVLDRALGELGGGVRRGGWSVGS
jgi:hypothetical protein